MHCVSGIEYKESGSLFVGSTAFPLDHSCSRVEIRKFKCDFKIILALFCRWMRTRNDTENILQLFVSARLKSILEFRNIQLKLTKNYLEFSTYLGLDPVNYSYFRTLRSSQKSRFRFFYTCIARSLKLDIRQWNIADSCTLKQSISFLSQNTFSTCMFHSRTTVRWRYRPYEYIV